MPEDYPPRHHLLRDLRLTVERGGETLRVTAPVVPGILTDRGAVRAGALGIAFDVLGGNLAIEAAAPDWSVTAEMKLHLLRPLSAGTLHVTGRALRAGRTNLVIEAEIGGDEGEPSAVGTMTFTRLPRREGNPVYEPEGGDRYEFAFEDSKLGKPLLEALEIGARGDGPLEMPLRPYVRNSLGALQGGALVTLVEASAERAARAALERPVVTTDFAVHYLALGRVGPIRALASVLRSDAAGALVRVELRDTGADDRLVTLASAHTGELAS